jgi:uncharacterized membrane protein (DUF485 family)
MTVTSSATGRPLTVDSVDHSDERLEQLVRQQRILAWAFSIATLIVTVIFFAMMTLAAPLLSRVVLGHSITLATVAAVIIISSYIAQIIFFGLRSSKIDQLRQLRSEL